MTTRRHFLRTSLTATAAAPALSLPALASTAATPIVAPSDRLRIGAIGINGMGWSDVQAHLKVPGVEVVALCDVDQNVLTKRAAELEKQTGKKAQTYGDYRKLLENKDIDAVIIGTPDHWHCLMMTDACEAGKDVYVEKPLANTIEECNRMMAAARRTNKIVQVGQWQRSSPHFYNAIDYVHSGKLGKLRIVKVWSYIGWKSEVPTQPDGPVPPGVDYAMWLGPAPRRPFNINRFHFNFRWYWDYAGGLMTDWGVHLIDIALWGMKQTAPKSIMSLGGKYGYPADARETPDTQQAIYDFGDVTMSWEHTIGINGANYNRPHGIAFIGENGTLVVDRGGWELYPETVTDKGIVRYKLEHLPKQSPQGNGLDNHAVNFVDCIKSRKQPTCNTDVAQGAALNSHLGNIAFRTGRRLFWNMEKGEFSNDPQANALLKANYQNGWKLPA
ncbi:putative dehydrogenase [Spirosoma lacussanchae]|uniref:Gfo/Idh/MocA family protein n=1 Tax=Spirosoma lacussanchae TaxID=1884249 RepID=UPI00110869EE|nr:Gfo/Idh/MocA family oxidoreductase [Spirosoma lacussanchae]